MRNFVVVTSIFEASDATRKFANLEDWQLVVVGDKKTPADWHCDNAVFLSAQDQLRLRYPLVDRLPWNHYCRKMLGYLYAIEHGAELIADADDDNIPLPGWDRQPVHSQLDTVVGSGYVNIYRLFTDEFIWPRGFPLDELRSDPKIELRKTTSRVGIWQFLANNEPDVDAVYRLVFDKTVTFRDRDPVALDQGVFCPFNSQNTWFIKDAFPFLYLPAFVPFRFTDILRGIVAQPLLWAQDLRLAFAAATVTQERNPHDYLKDFESEVPAYLQTRKAGYLAADAARVECSPMENLHRVYESLAKAAIVPEAELAVCKAWTESLELAYSRQAK